MFDDASWTLYKAGTYRDGTGELRRNRLHVALCECQLPDGSWKDVLSPYSPKVGDIASQSPALSGNIVSFLKAGIGLGKSTLFRMTDD